MSVTVRLPSEAALAPFAGDLARALRPGDRVGLVGDLGAGKTTLARAVIRALAGDAALEVPSPTFTLVQEYDVGLPLKHADLYRVASAEEAAELGLGEGEAVELVEWPREPMPVTITLAFVADAPDARDVTIEGEAGFIERFERARAASRFVGEAGWSEAARRPLTLDASTRRYERLDRQGEPAVLMDAPTFQSAPGSYPRQARLADGNLDAFLAVGALLRARGLVAPQTFHADRERGFLLLEDLGDEKIAVGDTAVAERYVATAEALAQFHTAPLPATLSDAATGAQHTPPRFDADLCAVEVGVFEEWYRRRPAEAQFEVLWRAAVDALPRDDGLALRDVHSPNVLWRAGETGIARVGFIDYQDAMIAPCAYDVVSLAQDARVDVPPDLEAEIVAAYIAARPGLDRDAFAASYAVLGAQRATRILGVFRRLNDRDGKPQYLRHLPRVRRTLARNLAHPALRELAAWYRTHSDVMEAA